MSCCGSEFLKHFQHLSCEDQIRRAALFRGNLHVLPANSTTPTRLQCFQGGFFCRKARGIMLRRNCAATIAISSLSVSENAFGKARRAQEHFANSRDFDNVYADGNNHK